MKFVCLIAVALSIPASVWAEGVPTAFKLDPGATFAFKVSGRAVMDEHIYTYGGFVRYLVHEVADESVTLDFESEVKFNDHEYVARNPIERIEQLKAKSRQMKPMFTIEKGRRDRDYVFGGLGPTVSRFKMTPRGEIIEDDPKPAALPFYFGDLRRIVFSLLPEKGQAVWQSTSPLVTGTKKEAKPKDPVTAANAAFTNLVEVTQYDRFDLRPAQETAHFQVLPSPRRRDSSIKIAKQSTVGSFAVKLPFDGAVQAEWTIDVQTGLPIRYQHAGGYRINCGGRILFAETNWTMESMATDELVKWKAAEVETAARADAARSASRDRADAREQERLAKEARRRPTRAELAAAVDGLASDRPSQRREAVQFLAEHPLAARDRRIKKAVTDFAAEDDFFTRAEMLALKESWQIESVDANH